jgi:hypothetical protein
MSSGAWLGPAVAVICLVSGQDSPVSNRATAAAYIRGLLDGAVPNGAPPEAFDEYRDVIELLVMAHGHGGTPKVREVWRDCVQRHPELAEVVSADQSAAADEAPSDPWPLFTLADAYQPRPPLIHVVEGLFTLPSLSIVYGAPGTIKSLLLADLAVCVAAGLPWLPPLPGRSGRARRTHQVGVLWCDFDNGPRMTHERFEALGRARSLAPDIPLSYASMPSPWLNASDREVMKQLEQRILTHQVHLVIIDNLATVKGPADENSAAMAQVMSLFRQLAEQTGVAVILIHHQRKEFAARNGKDMPTRAGDRLRGHSSIEAAVDLALLGVREPYADAVTLHGTKVRGVGVPPFAAQFTYAHKPGTTELATAKFSGLEVEDQVSDHAIARAVLDVVEAAPGLNQTEVVQEVKSTVAQVGVNAIRRVMDTLEQEGKLSTRTGEHGAKLYDLSRKTGGSGHVL